MLRRCPRIVDDAQREQSRVASRWVGAAVRRGAAGRRCRPDGPLRFTPDDIRFWTRLERRRPAGCTSDREHWMRADLVSPPRLSGVRSAFDADRTMIRRKALRDKDYKGIAAKGIKRKKQGIGGWGGIRTHEGVAPLPVFKTGAFDRSATHPRGRDLRAARVGSPSVCDERAQRRPRLDRRASRRRPNDDSIASAIPRKFKGLLSRTLADSGSLIAATE